MTKLNLGDFLAPEPKIPDNVSFIRDRLLGYAEHMDEDGGYTYEVPDEAYSYEEANVISSSTGCSTSKGEELHKPVLDIDFPAHLEPSTTEGHFHLYLNKALTWTQYVTLLAVLESTGIIEPGFALLSIKRGASYVRKPGLKKPVKTKYPKPEQEIMKTYDNLGASRD